MKSIIKSLLMATIIKCSTVYANFDINVAQNGFTDSDIVHIYKQLKKKNIEKEDIKYLIEVIQNPYISSTTHAGKKFFEALSWYNDTIIGNKNGKFSLTELSVVINSETKKYLNMLIQESASTQRVSTWKMIQKLELLKREIKRNGKGHYKYRAKQLSKVNLNSKWNKVNTILTRDDFEKRVIFASYDKPVLIKFGLTYCVHCLLMENLGSVPAVALKYKNKLSVYKLWWNPYDESYRELNNIAHEQNITSSPMFNLYIDGELVKSAYAFPDENGSGLEDYFADFL